MKNPTNSHIERCAPSIVHTTPCSQFPQIQMQTTHAYIHATHTHTHTRTQHNALFPICYVNENKSISYPPPTIHKPIERLLHIHVMHIINFKIRNSYNAKTNAFVKYKKTTITTNSPLCADNPVPMTERCHRY